MQVNGTNGMNGATASPLPDTPAPIASGRADMTTLPTSGEPSGSVPRVTLIFKGNGLHAAAVSGSGLGSVNAEAGPSGVSVPVPPLSAELDKGLVANQISSEKARPTFDYPLPTAEQLNDQLPPLRQDGDVPLGLLLDRVVGKGYKDMRVLVQETLPPLQPRDRPLPIIKYAKSTRQTVLKYLAVLRWKLAVDTVEYAPTADSSHTTHGANGNGNGIGNGIGASHTMKVESEAASPEDAMTPAVLPNGIAKAGMSGEGQGGASHAYAYAPDGRKIVKGRLLDIRRLEEFMKHQNHQHQAALQHIRHVCAGIEGLRIRNPDLLTALALLSSGTYPRLPLSLTEPFDVKPPLTNGDIISTLHRLDGVIRYRLRCVDYVPSEMEVLEVKDGRVAFAGGRRGKRRRISRRDHVSAGALAVTEQGDIKREEGKDIGQSNEPKGEMTSGLVQDGPQWRAEVTWVNFDDYAQAPRWWLTGVEWWWRERPLPASGAAPSKPDHAGSQDDSIKASGAPEPDRLPGKSGSSFRKRLKGIERQRVLDYANQYILAPQPAGIDADADGNAVSAVASDAKPGPSAGTAEAGEGSKAIARRAVVGDDVSMAGGTPASASPAASTPGSRIGGPAVVGAGKAGEREKDKVDAPLVRLHNFIQHLSLTYQLEILYGQAMQLALGRWRGSLAVEMDKKERQLILRYWTRTRPSPVLVPGRRSAPGTAAAAAVPPDANPQGPLVGGILTISISDDNSDQAQANGFGLIDEIGQNGVLPKDAVLRQGLKVKWEVGDGGEGGGWRAGKVLDGQGGLELDPQALSIDSILSYATRRHAAHLTRANCTPILALPRVNIFAERPPRLEMGPEAENLSAKNVMGQHDSEQPVVLRIPLPVRAGRTQRPALSRTAKDVDSGETVASSQEDGAALLVRVSDTTGLVEIIDTGASASLPSAAATPIASGGIPRMKGYLGPVASAARNSNIEDRAKRTSMACQSVNDGRTRLGDDLGRLVTAVILEHVENQLRQLGYTFLRKLAMRSQDMTANDLHPATCIFIPLPTIAPVPSFASAAASAKLGTLGRSPTALPSHTTHYLLVRTTVQGLAYELLRMARVQQDGGVGWRLIIGDKLPVDLGMIRSRRGQPKRDGQEAVGGGLVERRFEVANEDLRDLYIYCNAMVAQSILEQQLKDRAIPYNLQMPPTSGSGAPQSRAAIAGMIPSLVMNVGDLLKDPRAAEVARSKVYMQLKGWWKGGKCSADTIVRLLHPPTAARPNGAAAKDEFDNADSVKAEGATPAAKTPKTPITPGAMATTKASRAAREEGITFDQASSVVTFHADDLARCVPLFLEQWERLSKVIIIAGEVSRLSRAPSFRNLRMLSFDLRSAIFAYAPQHYCSITYDPATDAYVSSFSRTAHFGASPNAAQPGLPGQSPAVNGNGAYGQTPNGHAMQTPMSGMQALTPLTPATAVHGLINGGQGHGQGQAQGVTPAATTPGTFTAASPGEGNMVSPHEAMAGLLSWRLNELVKQRKDVAARFINILCATLPLLSTVEELQTQQLAALSPDTPKVGESPSARLQAAQARALHRAPAIPVQLVIRAIDKYKLVWDAEGEKRYAVDAKYLPGRYDAVVFSDAAAARLRFGSGSGSGAEEAGLEDESCGVITPIQGWKDGLVRRIWQSLKQETQAAATTAAQQDDAQVDAGADGVSRQKGDTATVPAPRPATLARNKRALSLSISKIPPMRMDNDASLLVPIEMLDTAIKHLIREVETALAAGPTKVGETPAQG